MKRVVKHWKSLPGAVLESTLLEVFRRHCQCGTWGHGVVVGLALLGQWLGLMIFQLFSNLNDSNHNPWPF